MANNKKKKKPEYFWIRLTKDEYELPVAVAESPQELAMMLNVNVSNIYRAVRQHNGRYRKVRKI